MADNIFFKSADHKRRFITMMGQIGKIYDGNLDPEYSAALYILTADTGTWKKVSGYVDRDGIEIDTILEEVDLSSGHAVLVRLAGNLFNNQQHLDPLEFLRLDEDNFQVALAALKLRRYSMQMGNFSKSYVDEKAAREQFEAENREHD